MKAQLSLLLLILCIAVLYCCLSYLYAVATAPEPHNSVNPYSVHNEHH